MPGQNEPLLPSIGNSPLTRRKALQTAALGLALTSGCGSLTKRPSQPTNSSSPTPTDPQSTTSSTPAPTDVEGIEVPPCPEKPAEFASRTALDYAIQFEKSMVIRTTLREQSRDIVSIDVTVSDAMEPRTATQVIDGWLVRFTVKGPAYRYRTSPDSTEPDHVDPPMYVVNYFVNEETVRRTVGEEVDPRSNGAVVQCPPD